MNPLLFTDIDFKSPEAWGNFQIIHGLDHQSVYEALLRQDLVPFFLDLYDFPHDDNKVYLLDHYQAHLSNAELLGLQIPDLSTVDLSEDGPRVDWLGYHAQVHADENKALGLL